MKPNQLSRIGWNYLLGNIMTEKTIVTMRMAVHPIQAELWNQGTLGKITSDMSLRQIGELIEIKEPQKIKHHLQSLVSMGAIDYVCGRYIFPEYKNIEQLYDAVNEMMAELGAKGTIDTMDKTVSNVMDVLHKFDGGVYRPFNVTA